MYKQLFWEKRIRKRENNKSFSFQGYSDIQERSINVGDQWKISSKNNIVLYCAREQYIRTDYIRNLYNLVLHQCDETLRNVTLYTLLSNCRRFDWLLDVGQFVFA